MRSWSRAEPEQQQDLTDTERVVALVRATFGPGVVEVSDHEAEDVPVVLRHADRVEVDRLAG